MPATKTAHNVRPPRRAVTHADKPVIVYFPAEQVAEIDNAARSEDTDRSKWIRRAVRNFLAERAS